MNFRGGGMSIQVLQRTLQIAFMAILATTGARATVIRIVDDDTIGFSGTIDNNNCTRPDAGKEELICTADVLRTDFPRNTSEIRFWKESGEDAIGDRIVFSTTDIAFTNMQTLRIDFQSDPNITILANDPDLS